MFEGIKNFIGRDEGKMEDKIIGTMRNIDFSDDEKIKARLEKLKNNIETNPDNYKLINGMVYECPTKIETEDGEIDVIDVLKNQADKIEGQKEDLFLTYNGILIAKDLSDKIKREDLAGIELQEIKLDWLE